MSLILASPLLFLLSSGACSVPPRPDHFGIFQPQGASAATMTKPPMGWSTFSHYQRNFTGQDVLNNADALVSTGLAAKGYQFVNIDGGWMTNQRDARGNLQVDLSKFSDGMLPIAEQ